MICQRCGRCCVSMFVFIGVKTPTGPRLKAKPEKVICPNLSFDKEGAASCGVHDEPWYKLTPCNIYGNPDIDPDYAFQPNEPCRVGLAFRERHQSTVEDAETVKDLEDRGPFTWDEYDIIPIPQKE